MHLAAMRFAIGVLFILASALAAVGSESRVLKGHTSWVACVAFSPDGRTLASGSPNDTVKIWDVASGRELRTLPARASSVAFSPDGQTLAAASDETIHLFDVSNGRERRSLTGHTDIIVRVVFSPDGETIASAGDSTVRLWDVKTGRNTRTWRGPGNFIQAFAMSRDGRTLAAVGNDGTLKLLDFTTGRELTTLSKADSNDLAFSPDGRTLALAGSADGGKTVRLIEIGSRRELRTLRGHADVVRSVAFSPDGRMIATASYDKTGKLWDADTGRELRTLSGHRDGLTAVAFSPDGRTLATASNDNTVRLWDIGGVAPGPAAIPTPALAAVPSSQPVIVASPPVVAATTAPTDSASPAKIVAPTLDRRVALVIGNSHYLNAVLANPVFDADLVSASLRKVGFDVTEVKDADFAKFDAALTGFVAKEEGEGADIALFYFAGHGFALAGDDLRPRNYLITTSADMDATSDAVLRRDGLSIDEVIKRISAPAKVTLAFIDACRNDPFHRGAGDRGFEPLPVSLSRQIYIGMSTHLGKTAIDGVGGMGSPFAQAFVEQMTTPGLRIDDAFRALRKEVSRKTDGKQEPEILQDDLEQGALVLVRSQ